MLCAGSSVVYDHVVSVAGAVFGVVVGVVGCSDDRYSTYYARSYDNHHSSRSSAAMRVEEGAE